MKKSQLDFSVKNRMNLKSGLVGTKNYLININ